MFISMRSDAYVRSCRGSRCGLVPIVSPYTAKWRGTKIMQLRTRTSVDLAAEAALQTRPAGNLQGRLPAIRGESILSQGPWCSTA
jgi:hypothetical protein